MNATSTISRSSVAGKSLSQHISTTSHSLLVILVLLCFFSLTPKLQAISDTNQNGVSDVWERKYNQGNLFTTFAPLSDTDGDGWTAAQEAIAGTDPFTSNTSTGLVQPTLTRTATTTLTWPTLAGKKYTLFSSLNLSPNSWTAVGASSTGTGAELTRTLPLAQATNLFWRVAVTDTDLDSDGLTDAEEHQIGSSVYLADTNGDGANDASAYNSGQNPAGEDADGDGVPDDALYSAVFEVTDESHTTQNIGFEALSGTDNLHRYLTRKISEDYSISGSPTYSDISNGNFSTTHSYLKNGGLFSYSSFATGYEGIPKEEAYLAHLLPTSGSQGSPYYTNFQEVITGPTISATGITTFKTKSRSWTITNSNGVVVRSGTEVEVYTSTKTLSDSVTVQELWTNYFKAIPWSDVSQTSTSIQNRGPLVAGLQQARLGLGDVVTAGIIRDWHKNGDFSINGTLNFPSFNRVQHNSTNILYWLNHNRLKSLRWRWVRFNPRTPFDYEYAVPPTAQQQTFRFLVEQEDKTFISPGSNPTTNVKAAKGIVEVTCKGSDGTGWNTVDPSKFASYRVEDPVSLPAFDYLNSGQSKVTLDNFPTPVVSRDKFLAGSINVPTTWTKLEIEIIGPDGSLGKSSDLLVSGTTRVYNKVEDVLKGSDYLTGCQPATQKVWFVRDAPGSRVINYYTCFDRVGAVKIKFGGFKLLANI